MSLSENRKIRFGIIGTGKITGWFLAGASQDERFEPVAICSRSLERAQEFAALHNLPLTFTSVEDMAKCDDIDAVYIASPNSEHAWQAIECMRGRKHVLCEKPMASNAAQCEAMIDAARANGVVLMEAMIATMNPNFDILRRNLPRIGKVRRYFASYCQYSSRYDSYKNGELPNAFNPELSNGAVMDIGIYTIYPMVALFGEPDSVQASGIVLDSGVDGQGAVNFTYPDMNATVLYSKIANSYLPSEIEGEDGNLTADRIQTIRNLEFTARPVANSGRGSTIDRENIGVGLDHDVYYYETREFIDVIFSGRVESEINSHANSLGTLRVIDEIRRQLGVEFPADVSR